MEILEKFIFGKKGDFCTCEDGLVITDKLIAVIDGATAKSEKKFNGAQSGLFARKVLCDVLMRPGIEMLECEKLLSQLNESIRESSDKCHTNLAFAEYPRASIIIYNAYYNEIWSYGDCQCIINGKLYTHEKKLDVLASRLRAFYLEHALLNGNSQENFFKSDVGRSGILEIMSKCRLFENENVPFGYPVLNGFSINQSMIVRYQVKEEDEIVFSSDGYPFLKDTLAKSEEQLKCVLQNDPMCFRLFRTTKGVMEGNLSFDDRCYCRFRV